MRLYLEDTPELFDEELHDNPIVFCERCGIEHKTCTYTKQDEERIRQEIVAEVTAQIDKEILEMLSADIKNETSFTLDELESTCKKHMIRLNKKEFE